MNRNLINDWFGIRVFCLCVLVLFTQPLMAQQHLRVADGYDNQIVVLNPQLSFAPQNGGVPRLHYLSLRHLREIRIGQNILSQTFAYAVTPRVQSLRWKYSGASALPVVADFEFNRVNRIELKVYDGEQWQHVLSPAYAAFNFDFLLPSPNDLSQVEWAFLQGDYVFRRTFIVFATQRNKSFTLDTLGFVSGFTNTYDPGRAMTMQRHGDSAKSVAITTDSSFNVFFDNGTRWQQYNVAIKASLFGDVYGGTLLDGTPFWLTRNYFVQLHEERLVADSLAVLPTAGILICRALFQDEKARLHALYALSTTQGFLYYYVHRNEGVWSIEEIPLPSSFLGFALSAQGDTVLLAYAGSNREINLAKRIAPATWRMNHIDVAGDVGHDVNAARHPLDGHLTLAYYDRTNGDLKIAHGGMRSPLSYTDVWSALRVDSAGNVGRLPALAWANDTLHAVYLDDSRGLLQHGRHIKQSDSTFGAWQIETIDSIGAAQTRHQLLYDKEGTLRVAYSSAHTGELRLATRTQEDWQIHRFASVERADEPGEINLFSDPAGLRIGYVRAGRLRLGTRAGNGAWNFEDISSRKPVIYAVWATDASGRRHVLYRARNGFHDEIRHITENGVEQVVMTTVTNDTRLRLQASANYNTLMLGLVDDGVLKLVCYRNERWLQFIQSSASASEAGFDFLFEVNASTFMFYREAAPDGNPFPTALSGDLISEFWPGIVDDVKQREVMEAAHSGFSVFPNPFNAATRIQFTASGETPSTLVIHNVLGQVVREYSFNKTVEMRQTITWDGKDALGIAAPSGVYVVRLNRGAHVSSQKIVLLR